MEGFPTSMEAAATSMEVSINLRERKRFYEGKQITIRETCENSTKELLQTI